MSNHLPLFDMLIHKSLSFAHHGGLISNTLKFLVLQFLSNGVLGVLGHRFVLVSLVLFLDSLKAVVDFTVSEDIVELLQ
jgi:hypothetical protein